MKLSVKQHLQAFLQSHPEIVRQECMQFPDVTLETDDIRIVMISEVVPQDPEDFFYSTKPDAAFMGTVLPILEEELRLFPNTRVIMLMGDVAKKAVNQIARKTTKKSIIPNESTYKIRDNAYYWNDIRVFPSYIITGGNILIEKSKVSIIKDDLCRAMDILEA